MEVRITGRHADVGKPIKGYAVEKLEPLARFDHRTRYLEVVFEENHHGRTVEVIAHMQQGRPLVARVTHRDPMAAIDLAHDKLERLLTRAKEKRRSKRLRASGADGAAASSAARKRPSGEEE